MINNFLIHINLYLFFLLIPAFISSQAMKKWINTAKNEAGEFTVNEQKVVFVVYGFALQSGFGFLLGIYINILGISPESFVFQASFLFLSFLSIIYIFLLKRGCSNPE